ncbi:MAG: hypothetical protein IPL78_24235 [Chloroflexi bacterium]|nr:hypothetical protein [Chloroflexota bacterium]
MTKRPQPTVVQKNKPATPSRVIASLPLTSSLEPLMPGRQHELRPRDVLHLQRTLGNRAVQRLLDNQAEETAKPTAEPSLEEGTQTEALAEVQVELDLDGDEETELHTLSLDPETGQLMIHSDPETLEDFLKNIN